MRDIKFRAWDGRTKTMVELTLLGLQYRFYNDLTLYGVDTVGGIVAKSKEHNIPVMQYTGLNDKRGVEVWEGDILHRKIRTFSTDEYRDEYIVVRWNKEEAGFCCDDGRTSILYAIKENAKPYCVVGNIYQNPELLK